MRPVSKYTITIASTLLVHFCLVSIIAQSPVPQGNEVQLIASGFNFVEGPVWVEGTGLLFSDIPENTVFRWKGNNGSEVFLNPSGNSNGLALDLKGRLILAQHGNRQIARIEEDDSEVALATHYKGARLNSPNDLVIKSDSSVFFTDPPYGLDNPVLESETGFSGIYRLSPSSDVQLLDSTLYRPNGIAFSPDETKLYVNDSEARIIYVWDIVDDSIISNKREFARMNPSGYADGMKTDDAGNVYSTGPIGVWIFAPDGTVLDTIPVPGQTSNCAWNPGKDTLYITSGNNVYLLSFIEPATGPDKIAEIKKDSYKLINSPDPFHESTSISFSLMETTQINLGIYNIMGQCIKIIAEDVLESGNHTYLWTPENIKYGTYFIKLSTPEYTTSNTCIYYK